MEKQKTNRDRLNLVVYKVIATGWPVLRVYIMLFTGAIMVAICWALTACWHLGECWQDKESGVGLGDFLLLLAVLIAATSLFTIHAQQLLDSWRHRGKGDDGTSVRESS